MLCLARLIRCAMVASGTRNAFAISRRRQAADGAQRQRDRRRGRQRRMTAHEQQHERVVGIDRRARCTSAGATTTGSLVGHDSLAMAPRDLAAHVIGHAPQRDVDQPAARIVGNAVARPLRRRGDQRFLHGVLATRRSRGTAG